MKPWSNDDTLFSPRKTAREQYGPAAGCYALPTIRRPSALTSGIPIGRRKLDVLNVLADYRAIFGVELLQRHSRTGSRPVLER